MYSDHITVLIVLSCLPHICSTLIFVLIVLVEINITTKGVIADERFFALLKRYCRVIDPRANAMLMMKSKRSGGISELGKMTLNSDSTIPD